MEELFIGIEETNVHKFVSTCCGVGLSIEPLSRVCCGQCGRNVLPDKEYKIDEENDSTHSCRFCSHLAFCVYE